MAKLQIILFIALACIACCSARPTMEDEHSRRISKHDRSSAVRRHADVNVSTELAKLLRSRQRMEMLMRLIKGAEPGKQNISFEMYPHPELIPSHREASKRLLSHLNGETTVDNLRVRVVNRRPVTAPVHFNEFTRQADQLRQQAAMARTCLELQKTLLNMPTLRVKVKCSNQVPQQSAPPSSLSFPKPASLVTYGYTPARRLHINGHSRNNGLTLNRRHTYRSRRPRYYRG